MPKYKVPSNIQKIARESIEYNLSFPQSQRAAMKKENGKIVFGTGMRTARRLASGSIDADQMRLMRWALWGGSAARRFVNAMLKELERKEKKDK